MKISEDFEQIYDKILITVQLGHFVSWVQNGLKGIIDISREAILVIQNRDYGTLDQGGASGWIYSKDSANRNFT